MKTTFISAILGTTLLVSGAGAAELRMSWWGGDSRHEATQAALEVCGAKYGHNIKPEFTGWSGHFEKLTTQIAGGTEADIMQVNWPWLPIYSPKGDGFADLRAFSDVIDLSNWTDKELEAGSQEGVLNGLTVSTTGRLFVFNATTFEKAGIAVPTTWDELISAGKVFKEKLGDDYYPFEGTKLDAAMLVTLYGTQKTGKPLIDPVSNTINWSKEELAEAINFYQSLVDNHVLEKWESYASKGIKALHENPDWAQGKIAGTYQWDSTYFKITDPVEEDQNIVYSGILSQDGQKTEGIYRKSSMVFAVSKNSENQKAAAEILNCLMVEEEGVSALGTSRGVPASDAALEQLSAAGKVADVQTDAQAKVINAEGPAIHPFMEHPDVRSALIDNLEAFAYGQQDAMTAADEMIYAIDEVLQDNIKG